MTPDAVVVGRRELDVVDVVESGVALAAVPLEFDRAEEPDPEAAVDVGESQLEAVAQSSFVLLLEVYCRPWPFLFDEVAFRDGESCDEYL